MLLTPFSLELNVVDQGTNGSVTKMMSYSMVLVVAFIALLL